MGMTSLVSRLRYASNIEAENLFVNHSWLVTYDDSHVSLIDKMATSVIENSEKSNLNKVMVMDNINLLARYDETLKKMIADGIGKGEVGAKKCSIARDFCARNEFFYCNQPKQ